MQLICQPVSAQRVLANPLIYSAAQSDRTDPAALHWCKKIQDAGFCIKLFRGIPRVGKLAAFQAARRRVR
jgi:hypothetical protein